MAKTLTLTLSQREREQGTPLNPAKGLAALRTPTFYCETDTNITKGIPPAGDDRYCAYVYYTPGTEISIGENYGSQFSDNSF